ncbi:MAG: hypothetical protein JW966_13380 [Anaerolineae bacterium]|nr:hypothetical protein [Anaerolineae bacterium]
MNLVSLIVLLIVLMLIFQIKNGIAEPLIDGLHKSFVGLDEATIIYTVMVEDEIPVVFDLPLNQMTPVVLTEDVPILANATFTLPGGGGMINGRVDIVLPRGLVLPVQLDMMVPVNTTIPINLPVDVEIPLEETQLHDPFTNLRDLLEPYVRALDHLPSEWGEVADFTVDALQGEGVNLVSPSEDSVDPWPGFVTGVKESPSEPGAEGEGAPPAGDESEGQPRGPQPTPTPVEDIGIITPSSE